MSSTRPDLKFSDAVDERSFYRKFTQLPAKESAQVVRLVDHKEYFSAFGEDAEMIAESIYKTQSVLKKASGTVYVTISPQVFASVVRHCLVENSYKVEVYNKPLQLLVTATPGNLEGLAEEYGVDLEAMLRDGSTPMVAAVKFSASGSAKKVGVCLVDLSNKALYVSEFDDNDLFSNLESLLLQVNVKEVVLPSTYNPDPTDASSGDVIKLFQVLNKIGSIVVGSVKSSLFSAANLDQDLGKIITAQNIDTEAANNIELILASKGIDSAEHSLSFACSNALVQYLGLLSDDDSPSFSIDKYNLASFMKLDSSTLRALNIFPQQQAGGLSNSSAVSSIFDLLNKCKTAAGTRLLSQWLKQPLTDAEAIENRHSLVGHMINDTNLRVFVSQEWLPQVPDVKRLLKKMATGLKKPAASENKKLEEVVRLYQLITSLPNLLNMLQMSIDDCTDESVKKLCKESWLEPISKNHQALLKFQELVETTIDLSPLDSSSAHDLLNAEFNIKPEFDESLIAINDNLQATSKKIKQTHEEVGEDLNIDTEKKLKLEKHQQHGWCFRVTRIDSAILRNTGDKYIELQTVKAGVFFTTKRLRTLSQQYLDYFAEYNAKQRELIKEILSITLTYQTVFLRLSLVLSNIDVLSAFANVAIFAPTSFVKPKLHGLASSVDSPEFAQRRVKLSDARHPVLEVQDDVNFIANDVELANTGGSSFAIITGPNMGGKSTYIRQVGVIALMSQVGSYIPASDENVPELPIFDAILSRVGAGDSQLKGLSTFMIEMLETSSILATATINSLIIIDELGRGTSTYDGFGLAWAISEHLITQKQCFTLFATHFHELTKLSEKHEGKVQNLHVVAHIEKNDSEAEKEDDITLMYRVEPGISDKSFGIHVAELVKFPTKIVNMAKRKASELQHINVGGDTDPYVNSKRTKCTNEEISVGVEKLKDLLVAWRKECIDPETQGCKVTSAEAIASLQKIVNSGEEKNDKFVQEVLEML
ncbi:putative DNA mismatch repair protein [Clavispora lusitaniae]|uniref:DNA mismatch repair protein n=1 Tax=Clavispora lusitaniae TaxID=36911 RepID=A0ACD0WKK1_CLALS|nr:putative DNA mismatch repair protein [Clavispora lusitaniae]QFZ33101.1 putative DNA mismatch repair protein [Clavispora lusitaniae]QFZ44453.1 putative DNA mismatch repair protein [Clavispora lusitaniae]QFZ50131.1 putative DNA mismatch repair protein [Clavispora lusitaniae]